LPYQGGFVREDVILPGRGVPPPYQGGRPHDGTLTFFDATGRQTSDIGFHRHLGLPDQWHYGLMAVDEESGRLLVNSGERAWLLDRLGSGIIASTPPDTFVEHAAFWDAGRLVMVGSLPGGSKGPYLRTWRVQGDEIQVETEQAGYSVPFGMAVFPARGEIAWADLDGRLHRADGQTLAETGVPRPETGIPLWASGDGRALGYPSRGGTGVDVFPDPYPVRVAALACRPLEQMTQADLAAITETLRAPGRHDGRPFLELARDCLGVRFGSV
jgi:hypothetical protein